MTQQADFKKSVRDRMAKTGERYTAARAMLLKSRDTNSFKSSEIVGLFPGYSSFGGICRDTAALRNVLAAAGINPPHTKSPLNEALVAGLCGGIGFCYALFEYRGMPPMLSIMCRHDTMPDSFIAGGIERLGVSAKVSETTSAATARKALDAAIAAGKPALCVVDAVGLADAAASPMMMAGMMPTLVAVAGVDGEELIVDDGSVAPRRLTHAHFAKARALYKKGKHRLVTIDGPPKKFDLAACVRDAVAATARRFHESPYKGFASNFGFAGLEKWQRLLTDAKDKKGWPTVFTEPRLTYLALRRTHDGIEHDFTAPAAGRPLYAEFLHEAAAITADKRFTGVADAFAASGRQWRAISELIATCGDAAVEKGCQLGESARELFDEAGCPVREFTEKLAKERMSLAQTCKITSERAAELFRKIAEHVGEIRAIEEKAVATLQTLSRA